MLLIDLSLDECPAGAKKEWISAYLSARTLKRNTDLSVCIMVADDMKIEGWALTYGDRILWAAPLQCPEEDVECLVGDFCEWIDSRVAAQS